MSAPTVRGRRFADSCKALMLAAVVATLACAHSHKIAPSPASELDAVEVDNSGVPFAPAPEGLLRPGAIDSIQSRLHDGGFISSEQRTGRLDPPTREALRRFQAKKDLPATGLPSYRTMEALALQPEKIFFSAHRPPPATDAKSIDEGSVGTRAAPGKSPAEGG